MRYCTCTLMQPAPLLQYVAVSCGFGSDWFESASVSNNCVEYAEHAVNTVSWTRVLQRELRAILRASREGGGRGKISSARLRFAIYTAVFSGSGVVRESTALSSWQCERVSLSLFTCDTTSQSSMTNKVRWIGSCVGITIPLWQTS